MLKGFWRKAVLLSLSVFNGGVYFLLIGYTPPNPVTVFALCVNLILTVLCAIAWITRD